MKLHYRKLGESGEPLFILHGLFGSSDNWQTLSKKFAEKYQVYLVDQRNHGRSPHSIEFNYDIMVADFAELVDDLGLDKINILGHSMGGKTAIGFAAEHADLINKMIVVDISHKQYPMHHQQIIEGLKSIDLEVVKSRGEADRILAQKVDNASVRQFLLKNLYWESKGQLAWRINVPVLSNEIEQIIEEIYFSEIETNTLFIRGELSNYIVDTDFEELKHKFPNHKMVSVPNAGHWVHAEAPKVFYDSVMDFLG